MKRLVIPFFSHNFLENRNLIDANGWHVHEGGSLGSFPYVQVRVFISGIAAWLSGIKNGYFMYSFIVLD
jgi:hypothetical protein